MSEAVVMSFCVAGMALRGIPTCFSTRQTVGFWGRRNTFATLSEDVLHFSWQAQHFGHLRCHFAGRRSTLDVSCCVFFLRIALSALREVVTRCKFRGRRGIWWHVMKIDGKPRTKRRFCSRSIRKLVGNRWFWRCEVWKLPCLWEKLQKRVFFDVSEDVVMSFCVAGVALCDIPHVWGARLSWGWRCHA